MTVKGNTTGKVPDSQAVKYQLQKGELGQGTGYGHATLLVNGKFATWLKIGPPLAPDVGCTALLDLRIRGLHREESGWGLSWQKQQTPEATIQRTFFVSALGRVPKWGSAALSTGLLMSEGTDSVLRIRATGEGKPSAGNRLSERARDSPQRQRRGEEGAALTWKEGYPTGGGFLGALVMTLQPGEEGGVSAWTATRPPWARTGALRPCLAAPCTSPWMPQFPQISQQT